MSLVVPVGPKNDEEVLAFKKPSKRTIICVINNKCPFKLSMVPLEMKIKTYQVEWLFSKRGTNSKEFKTGNFQFVLQVCAL